MNETSSTKSLTSLKEANAQRLHVALWYILRAQNGSLMTTLGPKYIPYNYMEPLGMYFSSQLESKSTAHDPSAAAL